VVGERGASRRWRVSALIVGAVLVAVTAGFVAEAVGGTSSRRSTVPTPTSRSSTPRPSASKSTLARATVGNPAATPTARLRSTHSTDGDRGAAVGALPPGWTATDHTIDAGGAVRAYLVVRPAPMAGRTLPVVIVLHGRGMNPASVERLSHMVEVTGPAILVYPAGYASSWNAGACCGGAHRAGIDDVAFLEALVRQLTATQSDAAAHRVYLAGYSNGGRMAYRMACEDPGAFAGVAAVEAVPVAPCSGGRPLPVMIVASQGDPLLAIGPGAPPKVIGGYVEPTVQATVDLWRRLDGCTAASTTVTQGRVTVTTWADCSRGARVALALYRGGSHSWPQGGPGTPPAQALVWAFLHQPPQPQAATARSAGATSPSTRTT
jgi:polyhydroxybutyrate depolymerase